MVIKMDINNTRIYLSTWFPLCSQGFTLNSKRVFVKYVFDSTSRKVHLDSTIDVIQHELKHTEQIKKMFILIHWLWIPKIILQYIIYGHNKSPLEIECREAEKLSNDELRPLILGHCEDNQLMWY